MMLKIKYINTSQNLLDFFPYGGFISLLLFLELLLVTKNMSLPFSDFYSSLELLLEQIIKYHLQFYNS